MAYADFTLPELKRKFGLTVSDTGDLFAAVRPVQPPAGLAATLARNLPLAVNLNNEKARSELVVSPLLVEFKFLHPDRVSLFSGVEFVVDRDAGLTGRCDFILARGPSQLILEAPVCVVVEAKNDDPGAGLPQCLAGMVAAQKFNARDGLTGPVYGLVTTGVLWRFLRLDGPAAVVDPTEHPIHDLPKLFGILTAIAL